MSDSPPVGPGMVRPAFSVLLAAAGLGLCSRYFAPLPVPALTALGGGLLMYWFARAHRLTRTVLGLIAGAVPGGAIHYYMHYAEDRLAPEEGLWGHIGFDAAAGLALAASILAAAVVLDHLLARHLPGRGHDMGAK